MRSRTEKSYTKKSEINAPVRKETGHSQQVTQTPPSQNPTFFNAPLQPQPLNQPMRVSLDPASFLLLTALLHELKTQNDLEIEKRKAKEEEQQKEAEATKLEQEESDRRFQEVRHSLYM
jgi:hypothetical protein